MKTWIVILFAITLSAKVLAVESDAIKIESALNEIFSVAKADRPAKTEAPLQRYIDPPRCLQFFKGNGSNEVSVNGRKIDNPGQTIQIQNSKLDDYSVEFDGTTAAITGFVSGELAISGDERKAGPWRMESFWYKSDDNWYIEHLNLKELDSPKLEYYAQFPETYGRDAGKKWPLIVFLHGVGERGGTLEDVKAMPHSIPRIAATDKDFRFVAVSPLCPRGMTWQEMPYLLNVLIDEVVQKYAIDEERIYLTGLSMGGIGTWSLALFYPDRFAAIAPVCGTLETGKVKRLKSLPIWAFHGEIDPIISLNDEEKAIEALEADGADVRYTVYKGLGHAVWNNAYNTPELYDWFLQHRRRAK